MRSARPSASSDARLHGRVGADPAHTRSMPEVRHHLDLAPHLTPSVVIATRSTGFDRGRAAPDPSRRAATPSSSRCPRRDRRTTRSSRRAAGCRARGRAARPRRTGTPWPAPRPSPGSASATRHLRRSPGAGWSPSAREPPVDPPLSATDTTAVTSVVIRRSAASDAARPWPPPIATTAGTAATVAEASLRDDRDAAHVGPRTAAAARSRASAIATERWRPPVQPMAIVRYALPSWR